MKALLIKLLKWLSLRLAAWLDGLIDATEKTHEPETIQAVDTTARRDDVVDELDRVRLERAADAGARPQSGGCADRG